MQFVKSCEMKKGRSDFVASSTLCMFAVIVCYYVYIFMHSLQTQRYYSNVCMKNWSKGICGAILFYSRLDPLVFGAFMPPCY